MFNFQVYIQKILKSISVHLLHMGSTELDTVYFEISGNDDMYDFTDLPQIFSVAIWEVLINLKAP